MNQFDWEPEVKVIRFAAEDIITTSMMFLDEDEVRTIIFKK